MSRRPWTPKDEARLVELIAEGWPQRRIGEEMGRTADAIGNRAQKLGIHNAEAAKRNSISAQRAVWADPRSRGPILDKIKASWSPERRARQADVARRTTAQHGHRPASPEGRRRITAGLKAHFERRMSWIPADLRHEYKRLVRNRKADFARREIQRIIAARSASLSPFERQLQAIRNGAGIRIEALMPTKAYTHTLGGGSPL